MRVEIRRCPICPLIRVHAAGLASALREELGVEVQVTDSRFEGEFEVFLEGAVVAQRCGTLPSIHDTLSLIRGEIFVGAGA
jgi:hypothetical protein